MIFTASTVKDSVANIESYCRRNLAGGADHLLLFLDAPDPEVEAFCARHPQVTHVVADGAYWTPKRPPGLNGRQLVNANLALALLAGFDSAGWLFNIDADESLQIDRDRLESEIAADVPVVRISPLEAVSQPTWEGEVSAFKPLLPPERIVELVRAGVISATEPGEMANASWFSGHIKGKLGARPNLGVKLDLHEAFEYLPDPEEKVEIPLVGAPWLEHRHYESHTESEFVRKWMAHLDAGPIRLRPRRRKLMEQIAAVVEDPALDQAARERAFARLYREQVADDLPALERHGVVVAPVERGYTPREIPAAELETMRRLLDLLVASDKRHFNVKAAPTPAELFAELAAGLPAGDPVRAAVDRALERTRTPGDGPAPAVEGARGGRLRGLLRRTVR